MLNGKDILVIGARKGGYGASIAAAAVESGARVFGTTLNPEDAREQEFFRDIGTTLLDVPLRYDGEHRDQVFEDLARVEASLTGHGVTRLHAVIHTVAGGFPRRPSTMKAVGDILKGKCTFADMATPVKRNVYYVNAGSFADTVEGLEKLTDDATHFVALTYRGELPYFIEDTKRYMERLAVRLARHGKRTLIAALPEAWTQSSQFFTGIEVAVLHGYMEDLKGRRPVDERFAKMFGRMEEALAEIEGFEELQEQLRGFFRDQWPSISPGADMGLLYNTIRNLYGPMRKEGSFRILRRAVETVSKFIRDASGLILVADLIGNGGYDPGDVRQVRWRDLLGGGTIGVAEPREERPKAPALIRKWMTYEKDEIRQVLNMYGEHFLFIDRVIMETGRPYDGAMGFGSFTVPSPDENPIMKDHFVGMPLFGGHLQMEAVAQFGTFMLLKALGDRKLFPILTGTEFPDLNTMAPPGEKLTMMGVIRMPEKRHISMEAFVENRYARSKGIVRGMILAERIVRKMMSSF
jgi:3-hydroxymyristoyl/3-hydroxydecanoyl-(acyl carrier protein) dehydratase